MVDLIQKFEKQTKALAEAENLLFLQDTAAAQLSTLGVIIQKVKLLAGSEGKP